MRENQVSPKQNIQEMEIFIPPIKVITLLTKNSERMPNPNPIVNGNRVFLTIKIHKKPITTPHPSITT